jgi:hypothetical protein
LTRYRVPVTGSLLRQDSVLSAEGFRLISVDEPWLGHPDVMICTFEDDGAPADLAGKLVEVALTRRDGLVIVTARDVITDAS